MSDIVSIISVDFRFMLTVAYSNVFQGLNLDGVLILWSERGWLIVSDIGKFLPIGKNTSTMA